VNKILRGAQPAKSSVAQPTEFDLLINLKTAKTLGSRIPPSLRQQADQVIEQQLMPALDEGGQENR
jgi:putative ABC transport system substrate-binding protein